MRGIRPTAAPGAGSIKRGNGGNQQQSFSSSFMLLYNDCSQLNGEIPMKPDIHPAYRTVLFHDTAADVYFLIGSTVDTDRTQQHSDGNTYPYVALDVSSASHPMYTGQQRKTTNEGRIAGFNKRFATFGSGGKKETAAAQ
ncbi:50S ribosomal protein L31 type B [Pseudomonas caricapapayae]|uniref:Large ribosomal subunit protein bL31B n=1 Tax=Pseudomonas caricapapayae TaxID=46678 RepID=A0A0P9KC85_9PSED|nr:50S ribosomal protein L31 type B [Pseudomonas caricapapayae]RMM15574.1 50S ribosomal protein L31 type B [Pseudomonas caricapapayae]RMV92237.1 50S ribosomal protein L31 type B [Pseudomonas caricapapayae]